MEPVEEAPWQKILKAEFRITRQVLQHSRHFEDLCAVDTYCLPDSIGIAKQAPGYMLCQHNALFTAQCRAGISLQHGKAEYGEKAGVGKGALQVKMFVLLAQQKKYSPRPGGVL